MARKTKKQRTKSQISERRLITSNIEKYKHLISIGYNHDQAVNKLRKEAVHMAGPEKLRQRLMIAKDKFGVTGVTLGGIRLTKDVLDYIKELEDANVIEPYKKGQDVLKLKHSRFWNPL